MTSRPNHGQMSQHSLDPSYALGAAMAHEIGHVLLGADAHSNWGIMLPRWTRLEWARLKTRNLTFTATQAMRMRTNVELHGKPVAIPQNEVQ